MPASAQLGLIPQGQWALGVGAGTVYSPPAMPTSARPWMAHLYNNDWSFRASLGAIVGQRPVIRQQLNSGFQLVTVHLPTLNATIQPGNLIVITEEGGSATGTAPAGTPIVGGIIEDTPDTIRADGAWLHQISITPFVAELGDSYLNKNYSTATDAAQMVRDAIAQTNHLRCTPISVPSTGVTGLYNFNYAPCLDVINVARLIAGVNWSWFVDAIGMVWFQPINTNAAATFTVTPKDGTSRVKSNSIAGTKNYILVVGGMPVGASAPAIATYQNTSSTGTGSKAIGLRAMNPPLSFPSCTDTATLQSIANSAGAVFDRIQNRIEFLLPAYGSRILLGQPGGATMRYFDPAKYPMVESETGSGGYSSTYVVLGVELDGIQQRVTIGDVPVTSIHDLDYELTRIAGRTAINAVAQTPWVGQNVTVTPVPAGQPPGSGITVDGSIPAISINDGTRVRVQHGKLSSYTDPSGYTSPTGYGGRVVDASGNLLWDAQGLGRVAVLSTATAGGFVGGITSAGWTTVISTTFNLTRQTDVLVWGSMGWNRTAGTTADTFFGEIQKDSDADWVTGNGWQDGGTVSASAPNDSLTRTFFLMKTFVALSAGQHTINIRGTTTGDTFQSQGSIAVIALGGVVGG